MAAHPLREPLPDDLVTIYTWAAEINRSPGAIAGHWRRLPGWPQPVGRLQSRGRHGGGLGTPVYRRDELQVFRESHPQLWPERRRRLVTLSGSDHGDLVTLSRFAAIAGVTRRTVAQYRDGAAYQDSTCRALSD